MTALRGGADESHHGSRPPALKKPPVGPSSGGGADRFRVVNVEADEAGADPFRFNCASAALPSGADRAPTSACRPALPSSRAISKPMPLLAPVMRAMRWIAADMGIPLRRDHYAARREKIDREMDIDF